MLAQGFSVNLAVHWLWLLLALFSRTADCLSATKPIKDIKSLSILTEISSEPSCTGTATYTNYVPEVTVYVTVDGSYTVTVTDNVTDTLPTILYTPPQFCSSTVIYTTDSFTSTPGSQSFASTLLSLSTLTTSSTESSTSTTSSSGTIRPPFANNTVPLASASSTSPRPLPPPPLPHNPVPQIPSSSVPIISSQLTVGPMHSVATIISASKSTTTITVTKKTPVPVTPSTSSPPPVQYPDSGGTTDPGAGLSFPASTADQSSDSTEAATITPSNPGGSQGFSGNSDRVTSTPADSNPGSPPTTLATAINNLGTPGEGTPLLTSVAVSTSLSAPSATVTLVDGVPVLVEPSSVYVGGSFVLLPSAASSSNLVTINGETFTIDASEVIGASTTLSIYRSESVSYQVVQAATLPYSTITRDGVTITIEPTAAVIAGTTYAIGLGAQTTVLTIGGQTVTFDSAGVVFASTTYNPAMVTQSAYITTTVGQLIFTIDQSEAVVSGTTFDIGSGSKSTTTVIDGTTVVFGPSGVVLPSTTLMTMTGLSSTSTDSGPASGATRIFQSSGAATAGANRSISGSAMTRSTGIHTSNTLVSVLGILAFSMLPVSILL